MGSLPPPPVDLATLLGEMAALKTEVRTETRAARALREQLTHHADQLTRELEQARLREDRLRAELREVGDRATRHEASQLIALFDRVEALARSAHHAPARGLWPRRRIDPAVTAMAEGLSLLLTRIEDALLELGINRVVTRDAVLDVQRMEAVGTAHAPERPALAVVEEVAAGWTRGDRVVRHAKVIVNPQQGAST